MLCIGALAFTNAFFGFGTNAIILDGVRCTGAEERLLECPSRRYSRRCHHSEDAGVRCLGKLLMYIHYNQSIESLSLSMLCGNGHHHYKP